MINGMAKVKEEVLSSSTRIIHGETSPAAKNQSTRWLRAHDSPTNGTKLRPCKLRPILLSACISHIYRLMDHFFGPPTFVAGLAVALARGRDPMKERKASEETADFPLHWALTDFSCSDCGYDC
jgi:hypothetical protein